MDDIASYFLRDRNTIIKEFNRVRERIQKIPLILHTKITFLLFNENIELSFVVIITLYTAKVDNNLVY